MSILHFTIGSLLLSNLNIGSLLTHHPFIGWAFIGPLHWNFPLETNIGYNYIGYQWNGTITIGTTFVLKRRPYHIHWFVSLVTV